MLRVPQTDLDYADRVELLDEKIAIFKTNAIPGGGTLGVFTPPTNMRELGSVIYNDNEMQRVQRSEFYNLNKSKLTKPSETYPIYLYENNLIKVYPQTITTDVSVNYLRNIIAPIWNFTTSPATNYQYIFTPTNSITDPPSIDFELHISEQTNIITRILMYSGIIIQNPQMIQIAAQQVQAEQINSKS